MRFLSEDENSASGHASGYETSRGADKPFPPPTFSTGGIWKPGRSRLSGYFGFSPNSTISMLTKSLQESIHRSKSAGSCVCIN